MYEFYMFYNRTFFTTVILCILFILVRFAIRKKSSTAVHFLWLFLLIRLLFPVAISTSFGIIPESHGIMTTGTGNGLKAEMPENQMAGTNPQNDENSGSDKLFYPNWNNIAEHIWYAGILCFLLYFTVSQLLLKKHKKTACKIGGYGNVYEWEDQYHACVTGLLRPRIYVPKGLAGQELEFVLRHENMHIKRKDHIVIILYYAALCLNWFNPFCWMVYFMVLQDMELACDESVVRDCPVSEKQLYARTLIQMCKRFPDSNYPVVFLAGKKSFIKKRVINIGVERKKGRLYYFIAGITGMVLLASGLLLFAYKAVPEMDYKMLSHEKSEKDFGADLPVIGFADTKCLVIYDDDGVYIFELPEGNLVKYIDFRELGIDGLQGDNAGSVNVSDDAEYIQICHVFSGKKYFFDKKNNYNETGISDKKSVRWLDLSGSASYEMMETADYYSIGEVITPDSQTVVFLALKRVENPDYSSLVYVVKDKDSGSERIIPLFK